MSEGRIERGGNGELRLSGELDHRSGAALREQGRALIRASSGGVRLDCSGVERSNSVGLSLLLSFMRDARAGGQAMQVVGLPQEMRDIAKVSGLDEILPLGEQA
ncbi:STAS domain-containing protein [Pseudomonas sp. S5(2021)]|uniref:STAS domain-containing protein n=1 Tax=Stutzerimonas balearica TaxID=74829 RepID=UPI001BB26BF6|nr:STAS domain-containing protein [Stutzerimonas balearica]MBZ5757887.1 STAS domain-containing protein [Pseudomonas sp. S5(2021)]WAN09005.1 STAS domain-containing protein [Stutzerimonas balearica]